PRSAPRPKGELAGTGVPRKPGHVAVRAIGKEAFEPRFQFRRSVRFRNAERIETARAGLFGERGPDRGGFAQKSRSAYVFDGGMPASVSARIVRNDGRDFTRAYQFLVASSSFHGASPR